MVNTRNGIRKTENNNNMDELVAAVGSALNLDPEQVSTRLVTKKAEAAQKRQNKDQKNANQPGPSRSNVVEQVTSKVITIKAEAAQNRQNKDQKKADQPGPSTSNVADSNPVSDEESDEQPVDVKTVKKRKTGNKWTKVKKGKTDKKYTDSTVHKAWNKPDELAKLYCGNWDLSLEEMEAKLHSYLDEPFDTKEMGELLDQYVSDNQRSQGLIEPPSDERLIQHSETYAEDIKSSGIVVGRTMQNLAVRNIPIIKYFDPPESFNHNFSGLFKILVDWYEPDCKPDARNPDCFCTNSAFYTSINDKLNILHLAASDVKFEWLTNALLDPSQYSRLHLRKIFRGDENGLHEFLQHYDDTMTKWLDANRTSEYVSPFDIAMENDNDNFIKVGLRFLEPMRGPALVDFYKHQYINMNGQKGLGAFDAYNAGRQYTDIFINMVHQNKMSLVPEQYFEQLLSFDDPSYREIMLRHAVWSGDANVLQKVATIGKRYPDLRTESRENRALIKPGRVISKNNIVKDNVLPLAHLACIEGNMEMFNLLGPDRFMVDQYKHTALAHFHHFTDEEIIENLRIFKGKAPREDYFVLMGNLIMKNRQLPFGRIFGHVLTSKTLLKRRRGDLEYGLQPDIELPMTITFVAMQDMKMVEDMIRAYHKMSNGSDIDACEQITKLMNADALRVAQLAQDKIGDWTDHLRLAVLLLMVQIANVESDEWIEVMYLNEKPGLLEEDNMPKPLTTGRKKKTEPEVSKRCDIAGEYVRETYRTNPKQTKDFVPWIDAYENARTIVQGLGGTLDRRNVFVDLNKRRKKPVKTMNSPNKPLKSILKKESAYD